MLAKNIVVLYLQNTHFVLLFNILCIEFRETFCEASLNYSQHAGCKKFRYCLLWKGEKSHWCKDWGWCKDRSMTVVYLTGCCQKISCTQVTNYLYRLTTWRAGVADHAPDSHSYEPKEFKLENPEQMLPLKTCELASIEDRSKKKMVQFSHTVRLRDSRTKVV